MRRFDVTHRVILPEEAAALFGAIYSMTPDSEATRQAREVFFTHFPEWTEKARRVADRKGAPHDLTPRVARVGQRRHAAIASV